MRALPLNALRVFDAVSRHRSFHAAAAELNVTPSAISHQIRTLEDWLGLRLIERGNKHLKFDADAVALASTVHLAFSDIAIACEALRTRFVMPQLRVAVIPSVAICWLIPRLQAFRNQSPNIELKIMYAIFGQVLNYDEIDLAIVYAQKPPAIKDFETVSFLSGAVVPVCSKSFVQQLHDPSTLQGVTQSMLLHDTDTFGWKEWLGKTYPERTAADDNAEIVFEDFNLLRVAALAGQGIALCPPDLIQDDLQNGRLVKLSDRFFDKKFNYFIIYRKCLNKTPAVMFFNWLIDTAAIYKTSYL